MLRRASCGYGMAAAQQLGDPQAVAQALTGLAGARALGGQPDRAVCAARLAAYKVPKTVVFGPLPKTSTGKIQKFALREQVKALAG